MMISDFFQMELHWLAVQTCGCHRCLSAVPAYLYVFSRSDDIPVSVYDHGPEQRLARLRCSICLLSDSQIWGAYAYHHISIFGSPLHHQSLCIYG